MGHTAFGFYCQFKRVILAAANLAMVQGTIPRKERLHSVTFNLLASSLGQLVRYECLGIGQTLLPNSLDNLCVLFWPVVLGKKEFSG